MKWIQLPLFSLLLFWLIGKHEQLNVTASSVESTWLIRFEEDFFRENIEWPFEVKQLEIHRPVHSVIIQTSLTENDLKKMLSNYAGIARIERGYVDPFNSPVYPTGFAILEPRGEESIPFLTQKMNCPIKETLSALGWCIVHIPLAYSFEEFNRICEQSNLFKNIHRDEIIVCESHQTNDPMYSGSWHLQQLNDKDIDAPEGWALLGQASNNQSITIIEGVGFDTLNADLAGRFIDRFSVVDNSNNVYANTTNERHGTATSGIAGAIANNAISAAGLGYNKLKLQLIRIGYNVTSSGNFSTTSVMQAAAINRAMALASTSAISMSFGSSNFQTAFQSAITSARTQGRSNKGIPVFASSGNSGLSTWTNYPASYSGVIAVGATTSTDARASFSNYGTALTLSAPGSSIATTDITGANGYSTGDNTYFSGTSAASPVAATIGALMIAANNSLTETQVLQFLAASCEKVGGYTYSSNTSHPQSSWSNELGFGRVNMQTAIQLSLDNLPQLPDVTIGSLNLSSATATIGQTITINATQQIATLNATVITPVCEFRYSSDTLWSADDIVIGTSTSTLGVGVLSENESITYTIPAGTGTKYILVKADASSSISESNESNNLRYTSLVVANASTAIDVSLLNAQSSMTTATVGQSITISCTQKISSTTTTRYVSLQYRLSTDNVWQSTDTFIGSDLSTFTSTVLSELENITYTIPNQIGTRYLLLKADAGNSVTESNENNNVVAIAITISAAAVMPLLSDENKRIANRVPGNVIKAYPNPASTRLTIDAGTFEWTELAILNLNGQVLKEYNSLEHSTAFHIPVNFLEPGTYLIRLSNASDCTFVRAIIE